MHDGKRARERDDSAVAVATPVPKNHEIARQWRGNFLRPAEDRGEIFFVAPMQIEIVRVRARVERFAETLIDENSQKQHCAIDANAFDIALVVIRRADP